MIYLIIVLVIFGLGVGAGLTISSASDSLRTRRDIDSHTLPLENKIIFLMSKENYAVPALRRIADPTCGAPALEAQDALDKINNLEIKELTR